MTPRNQRSPWKTCAASLALALLALPLGPVPASAEEAQPTLVVAFHTEPARRAALRTALQDDQARNLAKWHNQGLLASYRLLFNRYADAGIWDGLEVLTFRDDAALAKWSADETAPGGLGEHAIQTVTTVVTTPSDRVRAASAGALPHAPVFLVIPYQSTVSTADYMKYLDAYTVPQFDGWIAEGVLAGYEVQLSRYPAGRPWVSTILLEYRDDAALARRNEIVAKVRTRLAANPAWKAVSDSKQSVRVEHALAVADELAAGGSGR